MGLLCKSSQCFYFNPTRQCERISHEHERLSVHRVLTAERIIALLDMSKCERTPPLAPQPHDRHVTRSKGDGWLIVDPGKLVHVTREHLHARCSTKITP